MDKTNSIPLQFLLSLIVILLMAGCTPERVITPMAAAYSPGMPTTVVTQTSAPEIQADNTFLPDEAATLDSLEQVDGLPFYVMHYVGDYGFQELLSLTQPTTWQESDPDWGCTVFAALSPEGERLLGRNFDWYDHPALLLFTDSPEGYASVSMVDISYLGFDGEPLSDQERRNLLNAPYLPFDGMNEMGLAVGMMAVEHAEGGNTARKGTLDELEVIRLLLDYAATVDEALAMLDNFNVDFSGGPPLHYLIADRSGAAAVVEYIDDQPHVILNEDPWLVATNFILDEEKPVGADSSCWRYNRAYARLEEAGGDLSPVQAMNLLQDVSQDSTLWSVVYEINSGKIQVAIRKDFEAVFEFQLK